MGDGCACQGVGIGIVMHIKRRQRCGAARVQAGIAFLTACRHSFFYSSYTRQNAQKAERREKVAAPLNRKGVTQKDVASAILRVRDSNRQLLAVLTFCAAHRGTIAPRISKRSCATRTEDRINKFIVGIQRATHTT